MFYFSGAFKGLFNAIQSHFPGDFRNVLTAFIVVSMAFDSILTSVSRDFQMCFRWLRRSSHSEEFQGHLKLITEISRAFQLYYVGISDVSRCFMFHVFFLKGFSMIRVFLDISNTLQVFLGAF